MRNSNQNLSFLFNPSITLLWKTQVWTDFFVNPTNLRQNLRLFEKRAPDARTCSKFWHSDCLYKVIHLTTVTVIQITVNFSLPHLRCSWLYSIKQLHVYSSCLHIVDYVFMFLFCSPPYNCFFLHSFIYVLFHVFTQNVLKSPTKGHCHRTSILYIYFTYAISIMYWSYCSCFKQ